MLKIIAVLAILYVLYRIACTVISIAVTMFKEGPKLF